MSITWASRSLIDYTEGAGFLLSRLGTMAEREWHERLVRVELTQMEFVVLAVLARTSPLRQAHVATRAGVEPRNIGPTISKLTKRGLIDVTPDPRDRRAKALSLTSVGSATLIELEGIVQPGAREFFRVLDDDEYRQLRHLLGRLYQSHAVPQGE